MSRQLIAIAARLRAEASKRGCSVVDRGDGHLQVVGGPLLVNYYPLSKRCTAYVAQTRKGRPHVSPEQAVAMAFEAPEVQPANRKRSRERVVRWKRRHWRGGQEVCRWCGVPLTRERAPHEPIPDDYWTLEHVIPLARGGLDEFSNTTLACHRCNGERGHEMPELERHAGDGGPCHG